MRANQGRVGATVVGIIAVVAIFLVLLAPPHSGSGDRTPVPAHAGAGTLRFSGQTDRRLASIRVGAAAQADFACPGCQAGFAITSVNPANPASGLNDAAPSGTSAHFQVDPGTYSDVRVITRGQAWTLTITPTG